MKKITLCAWAMALAGPAHAQSLPAQPPPIPMAAPAEPGALPLYGARTPGDTGTETWMKAGGRDVVVRNVTRPTLTPVLPDQAKATGAGVIVAPGGAFMMLAMDHEGWQVARALADRGIAAFVLKYRVLPTPADNAEASRYIGEKLMPEMGHPMQGQLIAQSKGPDDARAALAMVRANAAKWGVDPARLGIIGFSAGAMTARRVALDSDPSTAPAFVGYIYGPQDSEVVRAGAPPLFDAIALDDPLFPSRGFGIAAAWQEAGRPVEVHGYQRGGHGFGLGQPGTTTRLLVDQFTAWLSMQGFLTRKDKQ